VAKQFRVTGVHVSGEDQEVRWYSSGAGAIVYNYQYNTWSRWTVNAAGVARNPTTNLAVLAAPDGFILDEVDGLYRDNGRTYRHRVRFAWLRAGSLVDFQRVRCIGAVGVASDDHRVHVDVYYNEREHVGEVFEWDYPDDGWNTDTFGAESFGSGTLGDTSSGQAPYEFRDSVWEWRRRLARQKCSVISVAIDDNYSDGPGFVLTALYLELGQKQGPNRSPWRGGNASSDGSDFSGGGS
jgi:hypothetical protein